MSQMPCCWLNPATKVRRIILLRIIQLGFGLWAKFRDRSRRCPGSHSPKWRLNRILEECGGLLLRYTAGISLCLVSMVARAQSTRAIEPGAVLSRTTQLLKELSQSSPSTVPDAVLNRAQCVVLIPAGTRRRRPGTVSCRETSDQWNTPTAVTFEARAGSRRSADILIFVVTDAAVKSLRSGSCRLQAPRNRWRLWHRNEPFLANTS